MGVFGEYVKKVMKHWLIIALGIAAGAGIADNLTTVHKLFNIPWWAWVVIVLCAINVAQFLVWKELRQAFMQNLQAQLAQSTRMQEELKEVEARVQRHGQLISEMTQK